MERGERFYKISTLLQSRVAVTRAMLAEELEVSVATVARDLRYMRDRMDMPIKWSQAQNRYCLDRGESQVELPGLWFNSAETVALLTMEHLLSRLGEGFLTPHLAPLREKLQQLLGSGEHSYKEVVRRLRMLPHPLRPISVKHFERVASAVLERRRLRICHLNRESGETRSREVSPQRLLYYRNCWYMDAWCHTRRALRTFGLDVLEEAELLSTKARSIADRELDRELAAGYGIYAGSRTYMARLRFSANAAQWVRLECWHPEQQGKFDRQGRYVLRFPYSRDTELVMDILRHGPDVEVLGPSSLRTRVQARIKEAADIYRD